MACHGADSPWVVKVVVVAWAAQAALEVPGVVRKIAAADGCMRAKREKLTQIPAELLPACSPP
jgi:hypothetical protein